MLSWEADQVLTHRPGSAPLLPSHFSSRPAGQDSQPVESVLKARRAIMCANAPSELIAAAGKYNLTEIVRHLGVSRAAVERWASGAVTPGPTRLEALKALAQEYTSTASLEQPAVRRRWVDGNQSPLQLARQGPNPPAGVLLCGRRKQQHVPHLRAVTPILSCTRSASPAGRGSSRRVELPHFHPRSRKIACPRTIFQIICGPRIAAASRRTGKKLSTMRSTATRSAFAPAFRAQTIRPS